MMTMTFDTIAYAKRLKQAGCTEILADEIAEAQGQLVTHLIENTLATKEDIRELKYELLFKLGGLMFALIGAATTILSFIIKLH